MGNFKAWVEDFRQGWRVRHSDGVTREPSGRFKRFTDHAVEKTQTMTIDGKLKTGKWLADALARKLEAKYLGGELGVYDLLLELPPLVDSWLDDVKSNGSAWNTLVSYETCLRRFMEDTQVKVLLELTLENVKKWKLSMASRGLASKTVRTRLSALQTFCSWLADNNKIGVSPFDQHKIRTDGKKRASLIPGEKRKEPQYYTRDEFMRLDDALAKICPQTRLGCNLAHDMGLRKVEFVGDYHGHAGDRRLGALHEDIVWLKDGKADLVLRNEVVKGEEHGRRLRLTPGVIALLGSRGSGPLITLTRRQFDRRFAKARRMAGIKPTLDVHGLRDTFAKNYLQSGHGNLAALKELLGHSDIKTTQIYAQCEQSYLAEGVEAAYAQRVEQEGLLRGVKEPKIVGQSGGILPEVIEQSRTVQHNDERCITDEKQFRIEGI